MLSVKLIFKPVLTVHHAGILSVVISIFTIETMKYIYIYMCVCAHTHTHTHTYIHLCCSCCHNACEVQGRNVVMCCYSCCEGHVVTAGSPSVCCVYSLSELHILYLCSAQTVSLQQNKYSEGYSTTSLYLLCISL